MFVFEVRGQNQFDERVAEKKLILAVVEAEAHFIKVSREMLRRDFMPCPNNAALEKREGRFHGVCMHVTMSVFAGMVDGLVEVLLHFVERVRVDLGFIGHNDFDVAADIRVDDIPHSLGLRVLGTDQPQVSVALSDADYYSLVRLWTPSPGLAANVGFIYLDRAAKLFRRYFQHGSANPMCKVPCRLVGHFQHALELVRGHALAGFSNQIGRKEPLPEREVRIMENGSGCHAKLVMA